MSVILEQATADVHDMAREIMERFHNDLKERSERPGVRLCILIASNGDGPAEKLFS